MSGARRILIIGLDGATLDVVEPLAAAGRLPTLAALMRRGTWGPLRSTLPAATFPAWTSFMTGTNPGRHGVFDFTTRVFGTYRIRFVNGTFRGAPTIWRLLSDGGRRVISIAMPGTYPPERVTGVMVSGFDAPVTRTIDGSFVWPPKAYGDVRAIAGRLPFADVQELDIGPDWPAMALPRLLDGIGRKMALAATWMRRGDWDCLSVVFGESDTIAHHCWRFHDPASPRHLPSPYAGAVAAVYEALDRAAGELLAAAPDNVTVLVLSDHGSGGAGDTGVHLNTRLRDAGLLGFATRGGLGAVAGAVRGVALRWCPARLQERIFRRTGWAADRIESAARFAGIDWGRTVAFSEELDYAPSVWLNLRGREPLGTVAAADRGRVCRDVCGALEEWRDPWTRAPIVRRAYLREEIYDGPFVDRSPDIVLDLALPGGYSYTCLASDRGARPAIRKLAPEELAGGRGRGLNGTHRRHGLFVLADGGVRAAGRLDGVDIVDLAPTLLALAGVEVPAWMDGRAVGVALPAGAERAAGGRPCHPPAVAGPTPYGTDEEKEVAARLAALGYIGEGT
jgi:predicted AlkP superfamily phosphohydrolase/phosphomutase